MDKEPDNHLKLPIVSNEIRKTNVNISETPESSMW